MKILISSHFFHPSVGGIQQVSYTLAHSFVKAGHEVAVVTTTRDKSDVNFPFRIISRPRPGQLLELVEWCDVFFHNNISLQTAWPLLAIRRPWVVAHHTWIARMDGTVSVRDRLKQNAISCATNISVSKSVARHLSSPSIVIGNPYRDTLFKRNDAVLRNRDLVFLGRLVWDKGIDLLIYALELLKKKGVKLQLTIIGDGPESRTLKQQILRLGLRDQVEFLGTRTGEELVALLNAHKVMVIPSRWQEPFGLVALEGIACGCVAVGAECGGLPDAIGPAGITFACGDVEDMARKIETLVGDEVALNRFRVAAEAHLHNHTAGRVARKYLDVLEAAMQ